ncbi:MAG: Hsp33 family molecular chaperone HslO [Bdellovibrionales bacterium]
MSDQSDITYPAILPANDLSDEVGDNVIQTFQLETNDLRGRSVRMGSVLDDVLNAHDYPLPVAHLVAETMTLTALLASMLKYDGIFTLQTKGDGPISMLVADIRSNGDIRACATFDEERLEAAREQLSALKTEEGGENHLAQYLGKGYIAFTVDQDKGERYQGIVELKGASLIDCVQHYFDQSEQITTGIKIAVGLRDSQWRAGGIMLQELPEEGGHSSSKVDSHNDEDDWRRAMVFLESATDDELLDHALDTNTLLHRLYHEYGVRVFEPLTLKHQCRCDEVRVKNVLMSMPDEDVQDIVVDGMIEMCCEFCSHVYRFESGDFLSS